MKINDINKPFNTPINRNIEILEAIDPFDIDIQNMELKLNSNDVNLGWSQTNCVTCFCSQRTGCQC
jgi:hypothetical protein